MWHSIYQSEILQCLLEQEQHFKESRLVGKKRIALFDLDNTLVVGNIGDAVFAQLLVDGFPLPLTWKEFQRLCKENLHLAYKTVVRAMEGVTLEYITQVSKRVIQSDRKFLVCEGERVNLPKPNLLMQEIVRVLRDRQYSVFIVSASNDISAKIAGSLFFDVPNNNIAGINPKVLNDRLTSNLPDPIPVGIEKVAQYRLMCRDRMPMIVAINSTLDFPILHLCDPDGIAIIVGQDPELYEKAKRELSITVHLHRIPQLGFTVPAAAPRCLMNKQFLSSPALR